MLVDNYLYPVMSRHKKPNETPLPGVLNDKSPLTASKNRNLVNPQHSFFNPGASITPMQTKLAADMQITKRKSDRRSQSYD